MEDYVEVATGGTIPRDEVCPSCGRLYLYRILEMDCLYSPFCGNLGCKDFGKEVPEVSDQGNDSGVLA